MFAMDIRGFISFLSLVTTALASFDRRCLAFQPEKIVPFSTRTVLEYVPANTTLTFPDNDVTCNRPQQLVSVNICRIALSIQTSARSNITFEAWLPENWSGRFLGTGNGGIDGCIKYEDLAYTSSNGFASVGANNGKNGTGGIPFYHNPETVIDFAWRSLHTSVKSGKKLVKKFYGREYTKSYYLGCSLGGRQGIKSAEKFPRDFDGIVAGAPGVDFNNLVSWRASFFPLTGPIRSKNFIAPTAWKTWIHDEILRQCDTIDRVADGIIEDPSLCDFDPSPLLCAHNSTANCLSAAQIEIVKKIFSPYKYPNGTLIYPAMQPGSEINAVDRLYAGKPFSYSEDWFKYVVYNNPSWNASEYSFNDAIAADNLNPGNIRTFPRDLPDFKKGGGKLLIHHGQQDNQITSFNSNRFFDRLLNHENGNLELLNPWVRFFRISGMFHCNSGPGAWVLGQGGGAAAAGIPFSREKNVLKALVDWVEKDVAPATIEGTKFVNDSIALGVSFTRKLCRYPSRNTYISGDPSDPLSWRCQ